PRSRFHLFLGLGYPTAEDAERGLAAGLVTQAQATRIQEADAARRQPPWNTALGGAIGIHGEGGSSDWTLGCIAVENAEIEELWSVVPMGTRVVVAP
ncbi:MAG: L,D-transpeptidase, partial [Myxococcota bacterium]|nr:L,D-transpeptidase [Myxococcota bacterium]